MPQIEEERQGRGAADEGGDGGDFAVGVRAVTFDAHAVDEPRELPGGVAVGTATLSVWITSTCIVENDMFIPSLSFGTRESTISIIIGNPDW